MARELDLIVGPQLIGALFNWGLIGVLSIQAYLYYLYFPKDRLVFKLMVYSIVIAEWVHTGLITSGVMNIYLYNFGNPESPLAMHNSWFAVPIMCAAISMVVQIFFAWRIYMFSMSRWLAGGIVTLSIIQGSFGIAAGIMMEPLKLAEDVLRGAISPVIIVWISGAAATDIIIAIVMTTLLLRSRTGIPRSDILVNRMVQLVVETGMLTASCAIILLVLAKAPQTKNTLLYEVASLTITKVYANTLITNLNSRARIHESLPKVHISLGPLEGSAATRSSGMTINTPGRESYELASYRKTFEAAKRDIGQRTIATPERAAVSAVSRVTSVYVK
ncbi:hypothetical protein DAEQUDRAFT_730261 [Daedalea quercina L-15889]|uniref:DUF6534 domain-containing protein n=1 Tax=Daedalea quercina L-15889 TaxID=1314783 RepID=A0A165N2Q8_9APHY|nr:hypothetical protein DAEQUDRAFT_730261 [Daedalea quercina L-15889]